MRLRNFLKPVARALTVLSLWGCSSAGPYTLRLPANAGPQLLSQVEQTIAKAQEHALSLRQTDASGKFWNRPLFMGPTYVAQYFLLLKWLDIQDSRFSTKRLQQILVDTQLKDGSWAQVHDAARVSGTLDATVVNYWALKAMGMSVDAPLMKRAREFINARGGVNKTTLFVKTLLALFGQRSWTDTYWIAGTFITSDLAMSQFAQWIRPHLIPIAYLRYRRARKDLGPRFDLAEIGAKKVKYRDAFVIRGLRELTHIFQRKIIVKMLETQQPEGSWGGYTSANLFTLAAFDDYSRWGDKEFPTKNKESIRKARVFVSKTLLGNGLNDYMGTVCDGRYWDTILIHRGLIESGADPKTLRSSADYLVAKQVPNGGIPFGLEFEYAPDVDDTAEMVTALAGSHRSRYKDQIVKALQWILSMQNHDGGWGAFDRNNSGNILLEKVTAQFKDSADIFDDSSEDVTGHVLEAFGRSKAFQDPDLAALVSGSIRRAKYYLAIKQDPFGPWFGRWGVNYIYGTAAVVAGLAAVGGDKNSEFIEPSLNWIESIQNPADGGFGESTESYKDKRLMGKGVSTPSQTAWALIALVEGGRAHSKAALRAVEYLVRAFNSQEGKWTDPSVVGTGHPGIVYLEYPSYPVAFPLIALGSWLKHQK